MSMSAAPVPPASAETRWSSRSAASRSDRSVREARAVVRVVAEAIVPERAVDDRRQCGLTCTCFRPSSGVASPPARFKLAAQIASVPDGPGERVTRGIHPAAPAGVPQPLAGKAARIYGADLGNGCWPRDVSLSVGVVAGQGLPVVWCRGRGCGEGAVRPREAVGERHSRASTRSPGRAASSTSNLGLLFDHLGHGVSASRGRARAVAYRQRATFARGIDLYQRPAAGIADRIVVHAQAAALTSPIRCWNSHSFRPVNHFRLVAATRAAGP